MSEEKKDLRYNRTDQLLKEGLLELLRTKPIERITVKDLTERAFINRCTFYHHYQDIYDLLEKIEDEVMDHVLEMMKAFHPSKEEDATRQYFECFCQYIYENRVPYSVLSTGQENRFIHKMLKMIHTYMEDRSKRENEPDKCYRDYAVSYSIGGVIGVLHKWLNSGFKEPPEVVAGYVSKVFLNGMKEIF